MHHPVASRPIAAVKARLDDFIAAVKLREILPGQRIQMPGETAFNNLRKGNNMVNHWGPFFTTSRFYYIADRCGLSEASLRDDFGVLPKAG